MKKLALLAPLAALMVTTTSVSAADFKGSGATFPYSVIKHGSVITIKLQVLKSIISEKVVQLVLKMLL